MKLRLLILIVICILTASPALAISRLPTDAERLDYLLGNLELSYNNCDYALFATLFAPNCTVTMYDCDTKELYQFDREEWLKKAG